ncbi:S-layer homology domain-containing protein [Oscillatoria salina]|uniref:S-layer homology domain-containing protein n=1 Tax=Oscillatoria salina TaxID=331517 RepID=UPI001CCE9EEB|nr:S-layer homology domain-containing protein [Oscillatoria salina]MBZ8179200.1 S-layer homology domain-containing protein [Oscillatoria salina IIICB1]
MQAKQLRGVTKVTLTILSTVFTCFRVTLPASAQNFSDIRGHWGQVCIEQLAQRQIIKGYPDGTFKPNNVVNRAEFAVATNNAFPDATTVRNPVEFVDIPSNHWAAVKIKNSYQTGFISSYPGGLFRPREEITRSQALAGLASGLNYSPTKSATAILNSAFADANEIREFYREDIAAATEHNLVVIKPGSESFRTQRLNPNELVTRAELATFLCQALIEPSIVSQQYIAKTDRYEAISEKAESGSTKAELIYQKGGELEAGKPLAANIRLQVTRYGSTLLDRPVKALSTEQSRELNLVKLRTVRDLDGNGEPEIVVDLFAPNPQQNCCNISLIYDYQSERSRYTASEHSWFDGDYKIQDVDKNNVPEFHAINQVWEKLVGKDLTAAYPLLILQYRQGKLENVTREYPDSVYNDAYRLWREYQQAKASNKNFAPIFLYGYMANKYLLGQEEDGWERVRQVYQGEDKEQFITRIQDFLATNGYLEN